jgi:hypothetical protein
VSARPLRAPCVEMKYSSTLNPSRKFDVIGRSIISPTVSPSDRACRELTHLLAIASRAGIHHQEDRVQFLAALVVFEVRNMTLEISSPRASRCR